MISAILDASTFDPATHGAAVPPIDDLQVSWRKPSNSRKMSVFGGDVSVWRIKWRTPR
jgi:hypothetical protein